MFTWYDWRELWCELWHRRSWKAVHDRIYQMRCEKCKLEHYVGP